jgi:dienelactone hydrolase
LGGAPLAAVVALAAPAIAQAATVPAAIMADPPQDKAHPAKSIPVALPTGGITINGLLYTAAGAGPHPTVVLFHGFPGNEQNLDLARAIQRSGWNVLTLHYRGSWGSRGDYSITHCMEDGLAAVAWLRDPKIAVAPFVDAKRIVVIGHSLGAMVAGYVSAHDAGVAGAAVAFPGNAPAHPRRSRRRPVACRTDPSYPLLVTYAAQRGSASSQPSTAVISAIRWSL